MKRINLYITTLCIVLFATYAVFMRSSWHPQALMSPTNSPVPNKGEPQTKPTAATAMTPEPEKFTNPYASIDQEQAEKNEQDSLKEIKHHPEIEAIRVQQDIDALKALASITAKNKEEQQLLEKVFTDKGNNFYQALVTYDKGMNLSAPEDKYQKAIDELNANKGLDSSVQPINSQSDKPMSPEDKFRAFQAGIKNDKNSILKEFPDIGDIACTSNAIVILKKKLLGTAQQSFDGKYGLTKYFTLVVEIDSLGKPKDITDETFSIKSNTMAGAYRPDRINNSKLPDPNPGQSAIEFYPAFEVYGKDNIKTLTVKIGDELVNLNIP